ncbi:MAG: hypothetical protein Q9162_006320 [Coniocarpon cinnabarinum]
MFNSPRCFSGLLVLCIRLSAAVEPLVDLEYTSYQGVANPNAITQWLGMRYAAPPLGDLRFAAPEAPPSSDKVQDALEHGPLCLAVGDSYNQTTQDEDCLFLDVYAPSNATKDSALPVFFFIQGGGYASNSNPNLNGSGLITDADMDLVVVTFNYRVGPFGFLAGEQVSSINNGLKDHYAALRWVHAHISSFGGDPSHVVIGGDSAGAQSVVQLLTAYGGKDLGLFVGSAAESQSFPTQFTVEASQFAYDNLVIATGCSNASAVDEEDGTLACLRSLSATDFEQYNTVTSPFPGAADEPLYLYGPTIDDDLIQDYAYNLLHDGKIVHVPTIFGDDANGGSVFVPNNTANLSQSNAFLHDQFPLLTLADLRRLNELYTPDNVPDLLAPVNSSFRQQFGASYNQVAKVYGDIRYTCPGIYASQVFSEATGCQSWNYLYNVSDPTDIARGLGVPHTTEVNAVFGPTNIFGGGAPQSYEAGGVNEGIVSLMQGYWTSFIRTLDPNTLKKDGAATWEAYEAQTGKRIVLAGAGGEDSESLAVDALARERCEFLWSIGARVHQ